VSFDNFLDIIATRYKSLSCLVCTNNFCNFLGGGRNSLFDDLLLFYDFCLLHLLCSSSSFRDCHFLSCFLFDHGCLYCNFGHFLCGFFDVLLNLCAAFSSVTDFLNEFRDASCSSSSFGEALSAADFDELRRAIFNCYCQIGASGAGFVSLNVTTAFLESLVGFLLDLGEMFLDSFLYFISARQKSVASFIFADNFGDLVACL